MRWNLSRKGVEVASLLCPICSFSMEVSDHVFVSYELAVSIWKRIFCWLDIVQPIWRAMDDIFNWIDSFSEGAKKRSMAEAILFVAL